MSQIGFCLVAVLSTRNAGTVGDYAHATHNHDECTEVGRHADALLELKPASGERDAHGILDERPELVLFDDLE
eukprot:CAMPEP_0116901784 /NCGR_PEP_ID=MMETSP0467-20121206/9588_1 /TAXON_ID=283647 /ORGANISM="Mesodinium pulex, Strain SPMC105" /LENGTH=72 /DNA_ID=CAMNT_0004575421 /DNA_START=164 /DNA_END=382 /DNA_ORIENTATION=+